jgi:hypothetical protein
MGREERPGEGALHALAVAVSVAAQRDQRI